MSHPLPTFETTDEICFIRGLNYAPGDCDALEQAMGKKLWIPEIPLYSGHLPAGADRRQEEERLARLISEEAIVRRCGQFIAHSRGTYMGLLAAQLAEEQHHHVQWIAMVPAAADPLTIPLKENADSMEDAILHPLCATMPPEKYRDLLARHTPGLKPILKVMNPKRYAVPVEDVNRKVLALNSSVPILVLDCAEDPFRDLKRLEDMIRGRLNITISQPIACGHFPHIECPDLMIKTIKKWQGTLHDIAHTSLTNV